MKISVIIPAYNHEKYVAEAVQSVLAQSCADFELIVVDDGSVDRTGAVVQSIRDSRIKYYRQDNQGAHLAINRGISLASGEYLAILNSDDVFEPDRLERCLEFMESNPDYSTVISKVSGINCQSLPVSKRDSAHIKAWLAWYEEALPLFAGNRFLPHAFAKNILITTSNYFFRKSILDKVGEFHPLRYAHDWDMLLRLCGQSKIYFIAEPLLKYRIHDANTVQEDHSEARVKFEVNWLIAENFKYLFSVQTDMKTILSLLKDNHYLSTDVLMLILSFGQANQSRQLLDFEHPLTRQLVGLLS